MECNKCKEEIIETEEYYEVKPHNINTLSIFFHRQCYKDFHKEKFKEEYTKKIKALSPILKKLGGGLQQ